MTADNPILELLAAPLTPDWTVEGLAEQLLRAIAAQLPDKERAFQLDSETITDRQSRRILRPLLACLATKSGAESGTPVNLYGGELVFERLGPEGTIWIVCQFENKPGVVRVAFRQSAVAPARTVSRLNVPQAAASSQPEQDQIPAQGDHTDWR